MSSEHHLTMGEYQELAALLKKAERDGRLGEAMVFSGVAEWQLHSYPIES